MIELQKSSFHDLLPPNLKTNETRALSYAADRQFEKLGVKILKLLIFADIMSVDEWLCDFLALLLNIRVYDVNFPLDTKRKLIQYARRNSSIKGTAKAVRDIMATVHDGAVVEPWFSYSGDPYMFKIKVDTVEHGITEEEFEKILFYINDYKALRSHLEGITVNLKTKSIASIGGASISGIRSIIKPVIEYTDLRKKAIIMGASVSGESSRIVPPMPYIKKSGSVYTGSAVLSGDKSTHRPRIPPVLQSAASTLWRGAIISGEHVILKMNRQEEL